MILRWTITDGNYGTSYDEMALLVEPATFPGVLTANAAVCKTSMPHFNYQHRLLHNGSFQLIKVLAGLLFQILQTSLLLKISPLPPCFVFLFKVVSVLTQRLQL